MENIHIKLPENGRITNKLLVLEGKALEQKAPEKIEFTGDIRTVSNFLTIREPNGSPEDAGKQHVNRNKALIVADKENGKIKLFLDPQDFYGVEITAKLEISTELKEFFINEPKTFTKDEMIKIFRFNKLHFDNYEKQAELVKAFQKLSTSSNIDSMDDKDTRGNKNLGFVKAVTTNVPTDFILNIPIFKGFPPVRFRVEICLDVTEGSSRFWLESVELHEIIMESKDRIFSDELKAAEGFVIIYK